MIRVPVLLGPTAVGKTDLAIKIAEQFDMEIISCDSRQIYRFMDIGTAKPSREMLERQRHWMIDIVDPDQDYSCFQYAQEAAGIIRQRALAGKRTLMCGGSGLYFGGLSKGIGPMVEAQPELRRRFYEQARQLGNQSVFDELKRIDPRTAAGSHPANLQRNVRALEVHAMTGLTKTELNERASPPQDMEFLVMACGLPRDVLYRRIDERVGTMAREGLFEEFRALLRKGYGPGDPGMRCVGYKELFAVEQGAVSLPAALDAIRQNTRNYAKRQLTWLRHQVSCVAIDMHEAPLDAVRNNVDAFFSR